MVPKMGLEAYTYTLGLWDLCEAIFLGVFHVLSFKLIWKTVLLAKWTLCIL